MNLEVVRTGFSCPNCTKPAADYDPVCGECETNLIQNEPRAPFVLANSINRNDKSVFFYVSPLKLYVMSVVTLGFYIMFWFYKNWAYVTEHTGKARWIMPYAIFWNFTYYFLMKQMIRAGAKLGNDNFICPPLVLAIGMFVLPIAGAFLPFSFGALVSPILLIPTQIYINELNKNANVPAEINSRFSPVNIVGILVGLGIIFAPLLAGAPK